MSAAPKQRLTEDEYLAIEREAEFKSEFYNGEMFAMAGASRMHNIIRENLSIELGSRLKGSPCRVYSAEQRVKVSRTGLYTYPDLLIVCGTFAADPRAPDTLVNPQVIIEILSKSTEGYDRGTKFRHYQRVESVKEYVLIAQDIVQVERFVRMPDETWTLTTFDDPAGEMVFASLPLRVPMSDVYRDVELDEPPLR